MKSLREGFKFPHQTSTQSMNNSLSTKMNKPKRKRKIPNQSSTSNPLAAGILVSSILISHPSWGAASASAAVVPSNQHFSSFSSNSKGKQKEILQPKKSREELKSLRRSKPQLEGVLKSHHSSLLQEEKENLDLTSDQFQVDDQLPNSIRSQDSELSREELDQIASSASSSRRQSLPEIQPPKSQLPIKRGLNLVAINSNGSNTLNPATVTSGLGIAMGGVHHFLPAAAGYQSGLASTWSPPDRSVWFAKKAIIIISIFLVSV